MLWWIAGVNVALFVVVTLLSFSTPDIGARLAMPGSVDAWLHRPWTALTYMVTQVQFLHLLFNMLTFLWFGSMLLMEQTQSRLLLLYVGGGLCGALFYIIGGICTGDASPYFAQPLMGSSAAVLAIVTACGLLMGNLTLHLFFLGDVKLKYFVLVFIVLSFLSLGGGSAGGGLAHLGGVAFGAVYGITVRTGGVRTERTKTKRPKSPTAGGARKVASILEQNRLDKIRLDELLDKIKVSGYDSLSKGERQELDEISRRISK